MTPASLSNCFLPGLSSRPADLYSLVWNGEGVLTDVSRGCAPGSTDCGGAAVIPAVVDPHLHGVHTYDVMREADLDPLPDALADCGVGAYCASSVAAPMPEIHQWIQLVASKLSATRSGRAALCLGAHVEGTFISPGFAGAHDVQHIVGPDLDVLRRLIAADRSRIVTMLTMSPHAGDVDAFVALATAAGIRVALGHTDASFDALEHAVSSGASCVTHLFNAMPPISARSPGLLGLALRHNLFAEIIPNPDMVDIVNVAVAVRVLGDDRVIAISDAVTPATFSGSTVAPSGMSLRRAGRIMGGAVPLPSLLHHLRSALAGSLDSLIKVTSQNALRFFGRRPTWPPIVGEPLRVLLLDEQWKVIPMPVASSRMRPWPA